VRARDSSRAATVCYAAIACVSSTCVVMLCAAAVCLTDAGVVCRLVVAGGWCCLWPLFAAWKHYHCAVNEAILRNISRLYAMTGVAAAGYEYVNIDDCWQAQFRDAEGRLQADPHIFPSGIKKLCSDIHAEGNKFGICKCQPPCDV
jgi:hypothetical protein